MLTKIKLLLGLSSTDNDELLLFLIEKAEDEVRNYCHTDNIIGLDNAICDMVVYQYNRIGTEGLGKEVYSGISYDYTSDYPESILRQLRARRKLVTA